MLYLLKCGKKIKHKFDFMIKHVYGNFGSFCLIANKLDWICCWFSLIFTYAGNKNPKSKTKENVQNKT